MSALRILKEVERRFADYQSENPDEAFRVRLHTRGQPFGGVVAGVNYTNSFVDIEGSLVSFDQIVAVQPLWGS